MQYKYGTLWEDSSSRMRAKIFCIRKWNPQPLKIEKLKKNFRVVEGRVVYDRINYVYQPIFNLFLS